MALCGCLGCLPLTGANPPATSDGFYHLLRAAELARQLQAGVAYPRWAPDFYLGYGYPIFLFTPLLPYYLILAVHALGAALQQAMNVVEAATLVASGLFAYAWLRRTFGASGSAVGAVLYALAPYHLVNLYYRGDLSEFLAATWFPAILLALSAMLTAPTRQRTILLGFAIAALLMTHFISALLFLPVVALLTMAELRWKRLLMLRRQLICGATAALLGAGLSAVSWLPAVTMA
ncbi:MAG TPA: glycosyltransferase family 39 protein, partial [Chloroflexota bacterium]